MAITKKGRKQAQKYSLSPSPNNHIMRDRLWRGKMGGGQRSVRMVCNRERDSAKAQDRVI